MGALESVQNRLSRFLHNGHEEIFGTILLSFQNHLLGEIERAVENKLYSLVVLGTHAIIQTVAEKIFDKKGPPGPLFYLEHFVDGASQDRQFSRVASDIHSMRNVHAHQWSSAKDHALAFNNLMTEGWKLDGNTLHLNLRVYFEQFQAAYDGPAGQTPFQIWDYEQLTTPAALLVQECRYIRDWLDLPKKDVIRVGIDELKPDIATLEAQVEAIRTLIRDRYGLS